MLSKGILLLFLCGFTVCYKANGQSEKTQQGLFYKAGTNLRLGSVQAFNKRNSVTIKSNIYGTFSMPASVGDTIELSLTGYNTTEFVVTDFADKICFLQPAIALSEVLIKETSIKADLNEVKRGYRRKSVFYTGPPHYYYLVLKPMTFIYENFKSEVINARKFNRYAKQEIAYYEIAARFNDPAIKNTVSIKDNELEDFKSDFWPTAEQVRTWNDYELSNYIKKSYEDFKKPKKTTSGKNISHL